MISFLEPTITIAASADRRRWSDIITQAFAADPPSRWLYPDDEQYWRFFPRFVEVFGGSAIDYGTAEIAGEGGAAALWLPPGAHPDEAALGALLEESVDPARSRRRSRSSSRWRSTIPPNRTGICRSSASRRRSRGMATVRCCSSTRPSAAIESACPRTSSRRVREACRCTGAMGSRSSRRFGRDRAPPIFPMVRRAR